jgi:UDP-3-O-[3-hydroxymyristoyl] N-acetylglucosamine deacetylase
VPALDGSAAPFVDLIRTAGTFLQSERRPVLRVLRPLEVVDAGRRIRIEPASDLRISYTIDFEHPAIRRQSTCVQRLDAAVFAREVAPARTFGFLHEVSALLLAGFARGGSLENTIVLDDERVLNAEGLRWSDEFVRHKTLDLVGDLALLGLPLQGHVRVERGGHALHQMLVQEMLRRPEAWRLVGAGAGLPRDLDLAPLS